MRIVLILLVSVAAVVAIKVAAARSRSPAMRFHAGFLAFAGLCTGIYAGVSEAALLQRVLIALCGALLMLAGLSYWLERPWSRMLALVGLGVGIAAMIAMLASLGWDLLPAVIIVCMIVYAWELFRLRMVPPKEPLEPEGITGPPTL